MPTISRAYHAHSGNYPAGTNWRRYIVIHNTGNSAPAINEAKYAQNNQHSSSFHYVLDGSGTIYQLLDESERSWSVGGWKGTVQYISNAEVISIEVCSNEVRFTDAEIAELEWLVPQVMERNGIDAAHVVRHWDCHSGRKNCPAYYSGSSNSAWDDLRARITEGGDMTFDELWYTKLYGDEADWGEGGEGTGGGYSTLYNIVYGMANGIGTVMRKIDELEAKQTPEIDYDKLAAALAPYVKSPTVDDILDGMAERLKE